MTYIREVIQNPCHFTVVVLEFQCVETYQMKQTVFFKYAELIPVHF
jgi:hypothetical protein